MLDIEKHLEKSKEAKKKQRLGRGLGSLFSEEITEPGAMEDATGETHTPAPVPTKVTTVTTAPVVESVVAVTPATPAVVAAPPVVEPAVPPGQRIWTVGIDKVFPNKEQPRKDFDTEKIQELSNSIKEQGILQPITVRKLDSGYEIIAGERRWRAAQVAGLHEVPVIVKEADNKKVLEWALIENIQREDLNPIEEAEAYNQLIQEFGYTHQQLAERMGKERTTITNALRLLTLAKDVRDLIREQKISTGHAKVLLGLEILEQQRALAKDIMQKGLSVRALEKEVVRIKKGITEPEQTPEGAVSERMVESLATELQKKLGTKVKIDYADGKGRVVINFYSNEELTSLVERVKGHA